jgi:hypothetical protein
VDPTQAFYTRWHGGGAASLFDFHNQARRYSRICPAELPRADRRDGPNDRPERPRFRVRTRRLPPREKLWITHSEGSPPQGRPSQRRFALPPEVPYPDKAEARPGSGAEGATARDEWWFADASAQPAPDEAIRSRAHWSPAPWRQRAQASQAFIVPGAPTMTGRQAAGTEEGRGRRCDTAGRRRRAARAQRLGPGQNTVDAAQIMRESLPAEPSAAATCVQMCKHNSDRPARQT